VFKQCPVATAVWLNICYFYIPGTGFTYVISKTQHLPRLKDKPDNVIKNVHSF